MWKYIRTHKSPHGILMKHLKFQISIFIFCPSFDNYLLYAVVPNTLPELKDFTFGLIYSIHKCHRHKHEKSVLSFFRKLL